MVLVSKLTGHDFFSNEKFSVSNTIFGVFFVGYCLVGLVALSDNFFFAVRLSHCSCFQCFALLLSFVIF